MAGDEVPSTERAVRAPADAVETAAGRLTSQPRRQRVISEVLVAGASAVAVAIARRLRRR